MINDGSLEVVDKINEYKIELKPIVLLDEDLLLIDNISDSDDDQGDNEKIISQ